MTECSVDGCAKPTKTRGLCGMHYCRLAREGRVGEASPRQAPFGSGTLKRGYRLVTVPGHPLADVSRSTVYERRVILYAMIGSADHPCHWCNRIVSWSIRRGDGALNVDHLDFNKLNNAPSNLVPSCMVCNLSRQPPKAEYRLSAKEREGKRRRYRERRVCVAALDLLGAPA